MKIKDSFFLVVLIPTITALIISVFFFVLEVSIDVAMVVE